MQPMTRSLQWAAPAALLVLFGLGVGFAQELAGGKKDKGMTQATTKDKSRVPPIDAKLPATVQTATFALG